jgi:hypothetical protein
MTNLPDNFPTYDLSNLSEYFTPEIVATFAEVNQPRSRFQLEKFVVGQHDTPEMQYQQCVLEIQQLYYTIKSVSIEAKKTEIEIERLRATKDEIDELSAQLKELGLEQTRVVAAGAFRELNNLIDILKRYPKYKREDIENNQPEYWGVRLSRQAALENAGGSQAQASHLEALRQIGALEFTPEGIQINTNPLQIEMEKK